MPTVGQTQPGSLRFGQTLQPASRHAVLQAGRQTRSHKPRCHKCKALEVGGSNEGSGPDFTEEVTVFLTSDGMLRLPSRHVRAASRQPVLPTWQDHGLCIGASFQVQATNGNDPSRLISMLGFCRSVGDLSEQVEETVQQHGGLITFKQCRELDSGLSESLKLIVAIPFLWGVPPAWEMLSSAITMGGGVIDKTYRQWRF
ncbi:hypothetical protein WJX84_008835 [Apatococcus fuscideae]|uniref:DUF7811 domain-containing protein n=1 Tax=Apatococcus fuscideae TaxID=2026836 RepID=A0AAW1SVT6_9CHLO